MDIDRILDDYRTGDEDRRISLFLAHRDLREEFIRIEQDLEVAPLSGRGALTWLRWITSSP